MDLKKDLDTSTIAINQGIKKYNRLDKQITELMLHTEKHCRKGQHGYVWSLKLVAATREFCFWKTCKSNKYNNRVTDTPLKQLQKELEITNKCTTMAQIDTLLAMAWKELKDTESNQLNYVTII
eukprot:14028944-Ditylum_brightwellii.AAC.1